MARKDGRLHLIMPMGGRGSRFAEEGFAAPKPMIRLNGKPFFYWAVQSVAAGIPLADITFVILREHDEGYRLGEAIREIYGDARIVTLPGVLDGACLTCLEGVRGIEDGGPVLFNDCDHMFRCAAFERFCTEEGFRGTRGPDGALLTFESADPRYGFLEYDELGRVKRTVEKEAVSSHAICGAYYFKDRETFEESARSYLGTCGYGEYYMSGVYNELARAGGAVLGFQTDFHVPFGTPEEYRAAEGAGCFRLLEGGCDG